MHPIRRQRLSLVLFLIFSIASAMGLALYALKQNINLFYTPSQVIHGEAPKGHVFRVGGMVRKGSVQHHKGSLQVTFVLTDLSQQIPVEYTGILPDLFREGQGIVAQGKLNSAGAFVADEVLAKHDEKYMPPPVAAMLKQKFNGN